MMKLKGLIFLQRGGNNLASATRTTRNCMSHAYFFMKEKYKKNKK